MQAKIRVRGMVQGVSFRAFAKRTADSLKLKGYVKNLDDGSVEIYAEGVRSMLDQFISLLENGPGSVSKVDVEWSDRKSMFRDFQVIY